MAAIELRDVCKNYGSFMAIPSVNLTIADGEFCVFVGPSGCGKSTLLRTIAGLEDLTSGRIFIGEREVSDLHPGERGAAMVFQNYALYPHMSVRQNMGYALKIARDKKDVIERKVRRAAEILRLEPYLDRKPAELSGGQRQRVAIGRAIVRDPDVFLFDEPLSNLDAELRTKMRLELADLHRQLNVTMIYVTHDQVEAMTLADRIVVLREGRIEQIGAPLELYDDPANLFVARFIGSPSMNILSADAERMADGHRLTVRELGGLALHLQGSGQLSGNGRVVIGVRPEHFVLDEAGAAITLRAVENLGGVTYGYSTLPSGEEICVDLKGRRDLAPGDDVRLTIPIDKAFVFDPETEKRLH